MEIKDKKWVLALGLIFAMGLMLIFIQPPNSEEWLRRGRSYYSGSVRDMPDYYNAIEAFIKAVELDPNNRDALYELSNALMATNNCLMAMEYLDKLLLLEPTHKDGLRVYAMCLRKGGRYDDAIGVYNKLIELYLYPLNKTTQLYVISDLIDLENKIETLKFTDGKIDRLTAYEEYLRYMPDYYVMLKEKGDLEFELGQYSEALQSYNRAYDIVLGELGGQSYISDYEVEKLNDLELKINQTREKLS